VAGLPGVKRLSESDDKKFPRDPKGKRPKGGEVGDALRKVYDRALGEDIPPAMLDLLGKLD
jgi:anti-sigma factor NepR-like protein